MKSAKELECKVAERRSVGDVAEAARLAALDSFGILDTMPEDAFDELAELAAHLCQTPIAAVTFVHEFRQWNKSHLGIDICEVSRDESFCAHALTSTEVLVIPDAALDPRFAHKASVTGAPWLRSYAGAPIVTPDGFVLGTLCVIDTEPRTLTPVQSRGLAVLARQVMAQLTLRKQAAELVVELAVQQETQLALERSHRVLDGVLASTGSLVYAKDLDGRFLIANPKLHDAAGVGAGELLGRTDFDLGSPEQAAEFRRRDHEVVSTGAPIDCIDVIEQADGSTHHYQTRKFPLHDEDGSIYAVAGVSTNVTELVEMRREMADLAKRWQGLVERSQTGVVIVSVEGLILYANPLAEALHLGTATGSIVGHRVNDFAASLDDQVPNRAMFDAVYSGRLVRQLRWPLRQLDGNVVIIEMDAILYRYQGELCVQVELWDVTKRDADAQRLRDSESRWRALFAGSPIGIVLADESGGLLEANAALCRLLGRSESEILGRTSSDFSHPDDINDHFDVAAMITASPDGITVIDKRYLRPDGEIRWAEITLTQLLGPQDQAWTLAHIQDVTDRRIDERAIAVSEANLRAVSRVVHRIQSGADARQTVVDAAGELATADSVSLFEPTADGHGLRIGTSTDPRLVGTEISLNATSAAGEVFRKGTAMLLPNPAGHPVVLPLMLERTGARSVYLVPVTFAGAVTAVLVVVWKRQLVDLDDRRTSVVTMLADQAGVALHQASLMTKLESLALIDPLTGLPNRRGWNRRLDALLSASRRHQQRLTIALADLDHFKDYNDRFGHPAGDELLCDFALAATDAVRDEDTVARWGGEEFALALPDCSDTEAEGVLSRVRAAVPRGQTCSIGYATWNGIETSDELMRRADNALYAAKHAGRDRVLSA